jgi:hypothetical protein
MDAGTSEQVGLKGNRQCLTPFDRWIAQTFGWYDVDPVIIDGELKKNQRGQALPIAL